MKGLIARISEQAHLRGKIENVKANPASIVDIGMVNWGRESHNRRLKWVPFRYLDLYIENPFLVYTSFGTFNLCQTLQKRLNAPCQENPTPKKKQSEKYYFLGNQTGILTGIDEGQGEVAGVGVGIGGKAWEGRAGRRVGEEELELLLHSEVEPRRLSHFQRQRSRLSPSLDINSDFFLKKNFKSGKSINQKNKKRALSKIIKMTIVESGI